MKIIILGAGHVGSTVTADLAQEMNDITVVDKDRAVLDALANRHDVRTVHGHATHPQVLRDAGAEDADLIVATTDSDEVNIVACQLAHSVFRTPRRIARIRQPELSRDPTLFADEHFPINSVISPEQLVTSQIRRLIEFPGALQALEFAGGRVWMLALRMTPETPMVGKPLSALTEILPSIDVRIVAIYRGGETVIPRGNTDILDGDEVFFLVSGADAHPLMRAMKPNEPVSKRLMVIGGGNIGFGLAKQMERRYNVKVIDRDTKRVEFLADQLSKALVLQGTGSDVELLTEENVDQCDFFAAVTNNEEANVLAALLAKRLGAKKVLALVGQQAYIDTLPPSAIDLIVSPNLVTTGALLTHIRRGDVVAVHSLRRGAAESIEAIAHGDEKTSKVVGKTIEQIKLPPDTRIGCVVRGHEVIMAHHDVKIESEDHVILFVSDKSRIRQVEALFQVGIGFF
ncbi:MAG: Trk system potassium transporter TrkA [Gammaproteobacteria bacterium]|nr:Trk system potassium transporter TrkA [Gammaproteobacteria bacterium]